MRLGVVLGGVGAHAAAGVGVLRELEKRGMEPYAVCALQAGAWPAALFAAGLSGDSMEKALHQAAASGRRMIAPVWYERFAAKPGTPRGMRLNRMLSMQTGERMLSLCPGAALFPCRMMRTGQRVIFSTRAYMQDAGAMLAMQASVGFAARAVMGMEPFLSAMEYMGSALLGETDAAFACRQLFLLGVHRVLVVEPYPSPRRAPDALDLLGGTLRFAAQKPMHEDVDVLRVMMPESAGALSLDRLAECAQAGGHAAQQELDAIFARLGMARCRVLAFRGR